MPADRTRVALLGTGAMGSALAQALLDAGTADVTAWNRTPERARPLAGRGATVAESARAAVDGAGLVAVCLYDHASVRATLEPLAAQLRGRDVVNLTTTTPGEARELAGWAQRSGIGYLDAAIMATPPMIGGPGAAILYSGSRTVFDTHRGVLEAWAAPSFDGADAGAASISDLAMLSGMYLLSAGLMHGAAMAAAGGFSAAEFTGRAVPFLEAALEAQRKEVDGVDGLGAGAEEPPEQSLAWTAPVLALIERASRELGVDPAPIAMVSRLVSAQVDAGHGTEGFDRIARALRGGAAAG